MDFLFNSLLELITQTSTNLPPDVRKAMGIALREEPTGTQSYQALSIMAVHQKQKYQSFGGPTLVGIGNDWFRAELGERSIVRSLLGLLVFEVLAVWLLARAAGLGTRR